jgi:hypothetical protein
LLRRADPEENLHFHILSIGILSRYLEFGMGTRERSDWQSAREAAFLYSSLRLQLF